MAHIAHHLRVPAKWELWLTQDDEPDRLVVFVHGFGGGASGTWRRLPTMLPRDEFWSKSDLLFVDYDSIRESTHGVASSLRFALDRFYPIVDADALEILGTRVRESQTHYRRLILAGHSLGGLVLRVAKLQALTDLDDPREEGDHDPYGSPRRVPGTAILDGELRLFSPAIGGFVPSGWLGVARQTSVWKIANKALRYTKTFSELEPGSDVLKAARRDTQKLLKRMATDPGNPYRARIIWAEPDDVVATSPYSGDHTDRFARGRTHMGVCKTTHDYDLTRTFIETGRIP
jgi:pimeloyl-ACP methyl ester carboxylesterase